MAEPLQKPDDTIEHSPIGDLHDTFRIKRDSINELINISQQLLIHADIIEHVEKKKHISDCHLAVTDFVSKVKSIVNYEATEAGTTKPNPIPEIKTKLEMIIERLLELEKEEKKAEAKLFATVRLSKELDLVQKAKRHVDEIHNEYKKVTSSRKGN